MTTKIWSLFQFPPQLGLAAAASVPLLSSPIALLRTQTLLMGRRGYSIIGGKGGAVTQRRARRVEGAGAGAVRRRARLLDPAALRRAVAHGIRPELVGARRPRQPDARQLAIRLHRVQPDAACVAEHVRARRGRGDRGNRAGDRRSAISAFAGSSGAIRCSAFSPPRPSRFPASCSRSASSSPTRIRR